MKQKQGTIEKQLCNRNHTISPGSDGRWLIFSSNADSLLLLYLLNHIL